MNRTRAKQIAAAAQNVGELDELLYFVEMEVPRHLRTSPDAARVAATYPAGWIPVIPLAPDQRAAEHYAHLLFALMEDANRGSGILFRVELTSRSVMDGYKLSYYVWGEEIPVQVDAICPECGSIHRVTPGQPERSCERTRDLHPASRGTATGRLDGGERTMNSQWIPCDADNPPPADTPMLVWATAVQHGDIFLPAGPVWCYEGCYKFGKPGVDYTHYMLIGAPD